MTPHIVQAKGAHVAGGGIDRTYTNDSLDSIIVGPQVILQSKIDPDKEGQEVNDQGPSSIKHRGPLKESHAQRAKRQQATVSPKVNKRTLE